MSADVAGLRADLQAALTTAMRARDRPAVAALRSLLAAIANAEAVEVVEVRRDAQPGGTPTSGPIAGAVTGLGAGDVARRELTPDDLRAVVRAEVDERVVAAEQLASGGAADRAAQLRAEVEALSPFVA